MCKQYGRFSFNTYKFRNFVDLNLNIYIYIYICIWYTLTNLNLSIYIYLYIQVILMKKQRLFLKRYFDMISSTVLLKSSLYFFYLRKFIFHNAKINKKHSLFDKFFVILSYVNIFLSLRNIYLSIYLSVYLSIYLYIIYNVPYYLHNNI